MNLKGDILTFKANQMPRVRFWAQSLFDGDWYMGPHSLTYHAMIIVTSGTARFYLDGEAVDMQSGDVLVYYPGVIIASETPPHDPFGCISIHFELLQNEQYLTESMCLRNIEESLVAIENSTRDSLFLTAETAMETVYLPRQSPIGDALEDVLEITQNAVREFARPGYGTALLLSSYLNTVFILISRNYLSASEKLGKHSHPPRTSKIVQDAVYLISSEYDKSINVQKLARQLRVTPQHLIRLFRRHLSMSPLAYIHKERMTHACQMLKTSSLSIKEISFACGFSDQYQFSRLFRKMNNCSPSEYRARVKMPDSAVRN